jgi:DNA polymerase III gamma/tau subunit
MSKNGQEIYRRCRPAKFNEVVGQDAAVKVLQGLLAKTFPHALLLCGPSGVGKTTLARILSEKLGCDPNYCYEINAAESRGIDTIRDIKNRAGTRPLKGDCRLWVLDEAHKLTSDAQTALLKMLEDPPDYAYFILCTTDPHKLLATIQTRCSTVRLNALTPALIRDAVTASLARANCEALSDEEMDELVQVSGGSVRRALQITEQALTQDGDDRLEAIRRGDTQKVGIDLARALIKSGVKWPELRVLIDAIDDEPETVRRIVLGYCSSVLLGGGKLSDRAFAIIQVFRDHWYDCGKAGLVASCYEIFGQK